MMIMDVIQSIIKYFFEYNSLYIYYGIKFAFQLCEEIQVNLAYRRSISLSLYDAISDPSSLT